MTQGDGERSPAGPTPISEERSALQRALEALPRLQASLNGDPEAPPPIAALSEALLRLRALTGESKAVRDRYDSLFNAVPDPVAVLDADGRLLDLNQAALDAYGLPREALLGRLVRSINPSLPEDHMTGVWAVLNAGRSHVFETLNRRADGSVFPVEVHTACYLDRGQRRLVAVARDLSQRRLAERRYLLLLNAIDKGIVAQGADGRIVSSNPAAARILGLPEDEPLSHTLKPREWRFLDEHGSPIRLSDLPALKALREGRTIESTTLGLYHRRRGSLSWISVTAVPQIDADDSQTQAISLFSDITELKRDHTLFQRAQSLARVGGWEWNRSDGRWYFTAEALRLLGVVDRPPATFDDLIALFQEEDHYAARAALERIAHKGGISRIECRLAERINSDVRWLSLTGESEGPGPLAARITGTLQDISERKSAESSLRAQARSDPLTGLLNRDGILAELEQRMTRTTPSGVAVLYIDLDRFKTVNDLLGHSAGDDVLIGVARRLRRSVGDAGLLARFGGDEFLVLLDAPTDPGLPAKLAERITRDFAESFHYGDEEFSITTSVGLACHPRDGETAQQLINNADTAMYRAKRRGRNTWQIFTPALSREQHERLQIETQLRKALANDEFRLVYQPQVDLNSGRILAAEALIRWNNPVLGEVRPDHFIGHAESTGDIVRIGAWALDQACRQLRAWRDSGIRVKRVGVNVSYRQFLNENLPRMVHRALSDHGIPGASLEVEFTERVLIEDAPDTLRTLEALRAMGVRLVIDDFGEGYSALNYLRRLPIDGLKISQSFLHGVPDQAPDVAICRAIIGIARSLGLEVVAEGVENEEQRRFLLNNGIRIGQGFLFGPGWAPERLEARVRSQTPLC